MKTLTIPQNSRKKPVSRLSSLLKTDIYQSLAAEDPAPPAQPDNATSFPPPLPDSIVHIKTGKLLPNPHQPRKHFKDAAIICLADSIRQHGILQPLSVRLSDSRSHYEIIAGERRYRAAILLGMETVPCIIIEADSKRSAELAIIENLQRENLNMFEAAAAISSLIEIYNLTQEQIGQRLSTSQSYVANKLRLLRFSESERDAILKLALTERHARALLRLNEGELRSDAIQHVASHALNVAATEGYVDGLLLKEKMPAPEKEQENVVVTRKHKIVLKDLRLFYNSIDKAVDFVREAGIEISSKRNESTSSGQIELIITITPNTASF